LALGVNFVVLLGISCFVIGGEASSVGETSLVVVEGL